MEQFDFKSENERLQGEILRLQRQLDEANRQLAELKIAHSTSTSNADSDELQSRRFRMVTVMCVTVEHSQLQAKTESLTEELNGIWEKIFEIAKKHNVVKIKSPDNVNLFAGGIPQKNCTNPIETILVAMEILNFIQTEKPAWDVSFGIHTGQVVASISGKHNVNYELQGNTVNIANRIELVSELNKVVISEMSYELVRTMLACSFVDTLPVKYSGVVNLYEVDGFKPEFVRNGNPTLPNREFFIKLGKVRFPDLEEYVLNRMETELPPYLHYHNIKHTMDVLIGVEVIGIAENITSNEDMLLLRTAALFHDMGQIIRSKGHENISCDYARDILPRYKYSASQIERICQLIMATKLPPNPKNLLECIICDADLDYLGREDFVPISDSLYEELHVQNLVKDKNTWNKQQIKFISAHTYFTNFAINNREVNKQMQITRLQKLIED